MTIKRKILNEIWNMLYLLGYDLEEDDNASQKSEQLRDNIITILDSDKNTPCNWIRYGEANTDYFETQCSHSLEFEEYDIICPSFCPYCGNKISINKD